jgi:hypothetical protein
VAWQEGKILGSNHLHGGIVKISTERHTLEPFFLKKTETMHIISYADR